SVSRNHAVIRVEQGSARVADLESHNGTKVNGEAISGSRSLAMGDVVSIGEVVLVVHAGGRYPKQRAALGECDWRRRLAEEIERALTYGRALSVVALAGVPLDGRAAVAAAFAGGLRLIDVS